MTYLLLECIASRRLKYEPAVAIICSIAYIFGLSCYIRTYPRQPPDYLAAFLTTWGFFLFLMSVLLFFAFVRTFSQSLAMWRIRSSNSKISRHLRYVLEYVKSQASDPNSRDHQLTYFHLRIELDTLLREIGRIDKLLARPGLITSPRIEIIATITPATLSVVASVLGISQLSFFPLFPAVFILMIVLGFLLMMTIFYADNAMEWTGTSEAIEMLDRSAQRLMVSCLGKNWNLILSERFHIQREPDSTQDETLMNN